VKGNVLAFEHIRLFLRTNRSFKGILFAGTYTTNALQREGFGEP